MKCKIKLPDGNLKEFSSCPSGLELARSIGPGLAQSAVAVVINANPKIRDIRSQLSNGDKVEIVTLPSEQALEVVRHSAAHVLAQAVQNLWPKVKVTIGPVIDNGFYYDFDTDKKFTDEDLDQIEKEMKSLLKKKYELTKEIWKKKQAISYFEKKGEFLKKEIIEGLEDEEISIYRQGPWLDLCRGPHVQHLGQIGAVKLLSHSGAYWRGDSSGQQLQRIYGTAFHTDKQLQNFLKKREEAKVNDHRKIGKKLNLFWFSDLSAGSPFFTPLGASVYRSMQNFLREKYREYGYEEVITPQIFNEELFHRSGHIQHFAENMYFVLEQPKQREPTGLKQLFKKTEKSTVPKIKKMDFTGVIYDDQTKFSEGFSPKKAGLIRGYSFLKPMNCPGHCLLYKKDRRSYRDLPWRVADFGRLHRCEPAGALQGLTRVKSFCQDDAHVFCRMDQLSEEIQSGIKMLRDVYKTFGLINYHIELSTRPEQRMGRDKLWDRAEKALAESLKALNMSYTIHPGEGAFYGPKLDICIKDAFDRSWQLGTFQCDFNLPSAFDLSYINEQDQTERPVMIHRAILGSMERFFGLYLEHSKGRLPSWLAPVPVMILPLTDREKDFSGQVQKTLEQKGIICKIDDRSEKLSYKIRESQNQQIPYMLIIGKKEAQSRLVSVRLRTGELFSDINLKTFADSLFQEIQCRQLQSFLFSNSSKGADH